MGCEAAPEHTNPAQKAGFVFYRPPSCVGLGGLQDFEVSGALRLAFHLKGFELVFIIMSVALVMKHADQQVLLVDIPDVNPMAQRFVGHMFVVAFSYFYSHLLAPISGGYAASRRRSFYTVC
ncbi:hypothetical protein EMIT0357P_40285 [Pseudomonas marginalis]